jgi:hypothetical protein
LSILNIKIKERFCEVSRYSYTIQISLYLY